MGNGERFRRLMLSKGLPKMLFGVVLGLALGNVVGDGHGVLDQVFYAGAGAAGGLGFFLFDFWGMLRRMRAVGID